MPELSFFPIQQSAQQTLFKLLSDNDLPTLDIGEQVQLFALKKEQQIIGTVGLECYGTDALLRSVSVVAGQKGKGYGKYLVEQSEAYARQQNVQKLYLLTTTAQAFFTHLAYQIIDRQTVPQKILQTSEFSSVCPSSAICMCKQL